MSADTSTRAVDRLAARMKDAAAWYKRTSACCSERDECGTCAAPACSFGEVMTVLDPTTLRALAAERDALREALLRWQHYSCPDCGGDCGSANPPVAMCLMQQTRAALKGAGQ